MRIIAAAALTLVLVAGAVVADTVYLRDGRQLTGKVTKAGGKVRLEMAHGAIDLAEADIIYIDYGASTQPTTAVSFEDEPASRPAPVAAQPMVRWDINDATLPEPIVFMLTRQQELVRGDPAGDLYAQQLKQWKVAVHEGKRRCGAQWLSRDDRRRHVGDFEKNLKDSTDKLRQAKSIYGSTPADVNKKKKLEADGEQGLYTAAGAWPDPLISEFLAATLDLRADKPKQAEVRFRRCLEMEPLVAGFHQGRGIALLGGKQALTALSEFCLSFQLRDDSYDSFKAIEDCMRDVPGAQVKDPVYLRAQELLNRYDKPKYAPRSFGGIQWLLPGHPWQARDDTLPSPGYERIVCKQALGVPISEDCLLLDKSVVAGAESIYVQAEPDLLAPATLVRVSASFSGTQKAAGDLPLAVIRAAGVTFTPVEIDKPAPLKAGQALTIRAANCYRQMGTELRVGQIAVVDPAGPAVEGGTLPGETLAAAFDADKFAGLLTGRLDAEADGCGKCSFLKPADLTAWATQVKRNLKYSSGGYRGSGPTPKPDLEKKAVAGQVFNVFVLASEQTPAVAGK